MTISSPPAPRQRAFNYGWVVVGACAALLAITYGLMYSYGVFFKPLEAYFKWNRETLSAVYSISFLVRGAVAIFVGWLADKYGPTKIMVACGLFLGAGLVLSGRVTDLKQFWLTYGVLEAIGLSGTFGVGTAIVSRWFAKRRGLALGIVSTGSGIGTLFVVPGVQALIDAYDWPKTFAICGFAAGAAMIALSFLLIPKPPRAESAEAKAESERGTPLWQAVRDPRMLLFMGAILTFFFCIQIVMVHLVNYATDLKISPIVAATFISVIGAVSIGGRLLTGAATDRTGIYPTLILTRAFLIVSFVWLLFTKQIWAFYVFAVLAGFPYGGEIPQVPLFIGRYWGTRTMATLVGANTFVITIGGALGSWGAGAIYDATASYRWAFIAGAAGGAISLILLLILRRVAENSKP